MYRSLARWCHRHHWIVIGLWLVALVGINVLGSVVGAETESAFDAPDTESTRGTAILEDYFPDQGGGFGGSIVFRVDDDVAGGVDAPEVQSAMEALFAEVEELDAVSVISPYSEQGARQVSDTRTIAYATVNLDADVNQTQAQDAGVAINEMLPAIDGVQIEVGGQNFAEFEPPESELIGLAFAVVVLIIAFGSVLAMGLPIGVAIAGVATGGVGLTSLLSNVVSIPDVASIIGVMIGLGVGIDYALFIVTRYRELTKAGVDPEDATVRALDTAGRAVVFAGITVVVSLLGMLLIGLAFVSGLGIAAAVTVLVTMIASVTLVPALLGLAHHKVEVTRWRGLVAAGFAALALLGQGLSLPALAVGGAAAAVVVLVLGSIPRVGSTVNPLHRKVPPRKHKPMRETIAYKWSHQIQAHPWRYLIAGTVVLLLLASPILGLRLGFSDEGNYAETTTTRRAYDLIAEGFGPGYNGPLLLAATIESPADLATAAELQAAVAADPGVASVTPPIPNDLADPQAAEAFIMQIIPTTSPQDEATTDTVKRLRDDVVPSVVDGTGIDANIAGLVAINVDFTDYLSGRILIFFGAVLGVSFLLLMMVFRSILVPIKAVVMNVLSIAAAYGAVVAIFQWGWLNSVFGVEPAPIFPFVPMMLFAIVFGLSMDYEVFLLSRVKEEYERTGDPRNSVADGLAATARVITAAAAIMVVVFGSFLLEDDRVAKLFGVGLALAVLLDATLVRMLLVPATMELLGAKNWWIPKWLDRLLPQLNVEGHDAAAERENGIPTAEPATEPAAETAGV